MRILVLELKDQDSPIFDKIMEVVKCCPDIEHIKINRDRREINLTAKEYDLLSLLVANKGQVLTYDQIYRKVWGEDAFGDESNAIGCHIRNLREKLYEAEPDAPFTIRCVREVGYCFEVDESN